MYPRISLCEEAKIKQRTPLKKELFKIGEEAIWEFRFTSFFNIIRWNILNVFFKRYFAVYQNFYNKTFKRSSKNGSHLILKPQ